MTEGINLDQNFDRSYEISVWTLQDEFITVLKWSNTKNKGTLEYPKLTINTDGTQNLSFGIPMSLYIEGKWVKNPIWYNITNGNLITNMRKIKVIFNKKTSDEEVFEFLITQMEMTHSEGNPRCEVTCSNGLAYHELGKRGYKIALSTDLFIEQSMQSFKDTNQQTGSGATVDGINNESTNALAATLDYWCQQQLGLTKVQSDSDILDPREWYYKVEMDWSSFSNNGEVRRQKDKIYEEEYVSSWDTEGNAQASESYKEKWRQVDESNSNLYNLTQNLAQTFGIYCKYKYLYDDNYHIVGRLIIFYNNFSNEEEGIIQFTYPYTTKEVTRTIDSADIVTKMYVDAVDDKSVGGVLSIANTEANRMQEDYLLNFDYLHEVKTITEEQYEAVQQYEKDIREKNLEIIPLQEHIAALEREKNDLKAKQTVAKNGNDLARKQLDDVNAQLAALTNADGIKDTLISYTDSNPDTVIIEMMGQTYKVGSETRHYYSAKLNTKGIIKNSIKLYDKPPNIFMGGNAAIVLTSFKTIMQDGEVVGLNYIKLVQSDAEASKMLFLTYDYNPSLYYDNVKDALIIRCNKYEEEYNTYVNRLIEIENTIESLNTDLEELLTEKMQIVKEFELMMGPALREGHWTPDDFHDYGDSYTKSLTFPFYKNAAINFPIFGPVCNYLSVMWDNNIFPDEQTNYYYYGLEQRKMYYPCVPLSDQQCQFIINQYNSQELKTTNIIFYDYEVENPEIDYHHWRSIAIGTGAQLIFIADKTVPRNLVIRPALIITEAENMSTEAIAYMKAKSFLTTIDFIEDDNGVQTWTPNSNEQYQLTGWYNDNELNTEINNGNIIQVLPRLWFHTLNLKNAGADVAIKYNNQLLNQYEDYSIVTHEDVTDELRPAYYYITLKPLSMLLKGFNDGMGGYGGIAALQRILDIKYTISNTSTAIYLDAKQILKENAYPKVSYSLSPNVINKTILKRMYSFLNRIININDNELQLHDAYGYISELTLDLDHPWQDNIVVQNYNNKFEDLFSTIAAKTEELQRREYNISETLAAVTTTGEIKPEILQNTLGNNNFIYGFNNNRLTLTEEDGLLGTSEEGCIAYRNNGIFIANTHDKDGNWVWQPTILPSGIDAKLIRAGQLDTDKIMIYSGNDVKFQWNSEGLYAYRSISETLQAGVSETDQSFFQNLLKETDINHLQYVVFNSDGLSLIRKNWNLGSLTEEEFQKIPENGIKQVEVSWNGFIMRNHKNEKIFYADQEGNLTLSGTIVANEGKIGGWTITKDGLEGQYMQFFSEAKVGLSGIRLTGDTNSITESIVIDNTTYYACYRASEELSENKTIYYSNNNEDHNIDSNGETVYTYENEHQSVSPKNTVTETYTRTIVIGHETLDDGTTSDITGEVTYRVIYIANTEGVAIKALDNHEIEYDNSSSLISTWYTKLREACNSNNQNIEEYVIYTDAYVQKAVTIKNDRLILSKFTPTFSVIAQTGTVLINNGSIGPFTVDENQFSSGTLNNSTLTQCNITDCYVKINNQNKSLALYGNVITDISSNNNTGIITFTRMNGTTGNFNIADMQYHKNSISAQSQIKSIEGTITHNNSNYKISITATSVYGNKSTKEFSLATAYKAGYDAGYAAGYGSGGGGGGSSASDVEYVQNNQFTHAIRQDGEIIGYESHTTDISGTTCGKCWYVIP